MNNLYFFLPELFFFIVNLAAMAGCLIMQPYYSRENRRPLGSTVSWVILLMSILVTAIMLSYQPASLIFSMAFKNTNFIISYKIFYLICSFCLLLVSYQDLKRLPFQYVFFSFIIVFAGLLLVGVNDFFILYLILELLTFGLLSFFVLINLLIL